jgi:DNA topoisomerase-1
MLKVIGKGEKGKFTAEELATISQDEVKKMIEAQIPDAFAKRAAAKKAPGKKPVAKKAAAKKVVSMKK